MLKKYKTHIAFFYICCAVSLVTATFFDLKIDIALNNPKDAFSLWFYATGEIPARLVLPLAGGSYIHSLQGRYYKAYRFIIDSRRKRIFRSSPCEISL